MKKKFVSCFDIGEVPRSPGKWNWHRLTFFPFIFTFAQCVVFLLTELATYKMKANFYISRRDLFPIVMFYDSTTKIHNQNVFCIIGHPIKFQVSLILADPKTWSHKKCVKITFLGIEILYKICFIGFFVTSSFLVGRRRFGIWNGCFKKRWSILGSEHFCGSHFLLIHFTS